MTPTPPSKTTLAKYGLSEAEWIEILNRQGGVCYVCEKEPTTGRLCVDHYHEPGWKKLPPEKRKLYVRGLLCFWCNKTYVGRAITVRKAERVLEYLKEFEARRPQK